MGLHYLGAAHAYSIGEAHWSKAQKEAIIRLDRFALTGDDNDFFAYESAIGVVLGDRQARLALEQAAPDYSAAAAGFAKGRNAAADIPAMIDLMLHFKTEQHFAAALGVWREADSIIDELISIAQKLYRERRLGSSTDSGIRATREAISQINNRLAPLEDEFSEQISQASGQMRSLVISLGLASASTLLIAGILVSRRLIRRVTQYATIDPLTGLPNRYSLQRSLRQAIRSAGRNGHMAAVLFFDLDGFKGINDTLGHSVGDQVLVQLGRRLSEAMRLGDTVARLGGDEFVVIVQNIHHIEQARQVAANLIAACVKPIRVTKLPQRELFVSASVGISQYPVDGDDPAALLMQADTAMYCAKAAAKNQIRVYSASMGRRSCERFQLESQLRDAIERREFLLHFQPIIDLRSRTCEGYEALLRWRHPKLGEVAPEHFIEAAERSGLIVTIGAWVIEQACAYAGLLHDSGHTQSVSVNLSPSQFQAEGLVAEIRTALQNHDLPGTCLRIEITENAVMEDMTRAIAHLRAIRALGVRVSLDDFGVGYSSMSYLKQLPIDDLKIDRIFIKGIVENPKDAAIVRAMIQLGQTLDMTVTAEGIESPDQLRMLLRMHCDRAQGYWIGHPTNFEAAVLPQAIDRAP